MVNLTKNSRCDEGLWKKYKWRCGMRGEAPGTMKNGRQSERGVRQWMFVVDCYTLNTTGLEYGYGRGRKVSETRHTVLGRHAETGLPTQPGLGSGQPTLRHQKVPGPTTGADRESASAAAEEDNLGGHHKDKQSEGDGNARSCESRSRNRSGVVSRGTAPRGTTPRVGNRCIVADGRRPEAILLHDVVRRHVGPGYHSHPRH